jgi:predicted enzyme related to lactoylglutathione lyase
MPNAKGSFIWYELMTTDANAAARFYSSVVGWKIDQQPAFKGEGRDYRMIARSDGGSAGGLLQLTEAMQTGGARPVWLGYLHVPDVDATAKAIEADGGRIHLRMDLPVGQIAMVTDPMDAPFYIMNPIPPPGQQDAVSDVFDATKPQHVNWNELNSRNLARAKLFYEKHFDFQFNEAMPMGEMGDYWFFDHAGQRPGAIMQAPKGTPLDGWLFYFGVPSVAAAERAIKQGGGRVVMEPHEVPGGSWIIVAVDPQGALFGVVGPRG